MECMQWWPTFWRSAKRLCILCGRPVPLPAPASQSMPAQRHATQGQRPLGCKLMRFYAALRPSLKRRWCCGSCSCTSSISREATDALNNGFPWGSVALFTSRWASSNNFLVFLFTKWDLYYCFLMSLTTLCSKHRRFHAGKHALQKDVLVERET